MYTGTRVRTSLVYAYILLLLYMYYTLEFVLVGSYVPPVLVGSSYTCVAIDYRYRDSLLQAPKQASRRTAPSWVPGQCRCARTAHCHSRSRSLARQQPHSVCTHIWRAVSVSRAARAGASTSGLTFRTAWCVFFIELPRCSPHHLTLTQQHTHPPAPRENRIIGRRGAPEGVPAEERGLL